MLDTQGNVLIDDEGCVRALCNGPMEGDAIRTAKLVMDAVNQYDPDSTSDWNTLNRRRIALLTERGKRQLTPRETEDLEALQNIAGAVRAYHFGQPSLPSKP